ncbi:hypothetical protein FRB94_010805 [Tulasnella sp. JGI-2019a]|nr:hypothetical protein FRB94_010805 [Tulasnella sp. JGI-2019a]
MSRKELEGDDDVKRGWAGSLAEKFRGSRSNGSVTDMLPPYIHGDSFTIERKPGSSLNGNPPTSPARILGVNEYGQIIGYISPAYPTASWFNFQSVEKAIIFDVPVITSKARGRLGFKKSPQVFRLRMRNPTEVAEAGEFYFLGVQLYRALATNEAWMLAACDEGKPGRVFKDRARMLRSAINAPMEGEGPVGNPASSKVWSIHTIDGDTEELRLNWLDKNGAVISLKATTEQLPKIEGASHHLWARRKNFVAESDTPIRLIVERCSEP